MTIMTERTPPVDTGSCSYSDMPPLGWLETQSATVKNEYRELVETLSDPIMSKDVHDAAQRALRTIWEKYRNVPIPEPEVMDAPGPAPSRGYPLDAVPADVVLPCLIDDGSGRERWLIRTDILGNGKRLFLTAKTPEGRCSWSFEEPTKGGKV